MTPLCEQLGDIHRRMHDICKEENRPDRDVMTATNGDLDALAAQYDLERKTYEADDSLRERVLEAARKGMMR